MYIDEDIKDKLYLTLKKDVEFFKKRNIMDYSLVVFIINSKGYLENL